MDKKKTDVDLLFLQNSQKQNHMTTIRTRSRVMFAMLSCELILCETRAKQTTALEKLNAVRHIDHCNMKLFTHNIVKNLRTTCGRPSMRLDAHTEWRRGKTGTVSGGVKLVPVTSRLVVDMLTYWHTRSSCISTELD